MANEKDRERVPDVEDVNVQNRDDADRPNTDLDNDEDGARADMPDNASVASADNK